MVFIEDTNLGKSISAGQAVHNNTSAKDNKTN